MESASIKKKSPSSRSVVLKAMVLSSLLIVLPFATYWYIQLDKQQHYEQQKTYRTLKEVELHINNELQALRSIQQVLPVQIAGDAAGQQSTQLATLLDRCAFLFYSASKSLNTFNISYNKNSECLISPTYIQLASRQLTVDPALSDNSADQLQNQIEQLTEEHNQLLAYAKQSVDMALNKLRRSTEKVCSKAASSTEKSWCFSLQFNSHDGVDADGRYNADAIISPAFPIYSRCKVFYENRYVYQLQEQFFKSCGEFISQYELAIRGITRLVKFGRRETIFAKDIKQSADASSQLFSAYDQLKEMAEFVSERQFNNETKSNQNFDRLEPYYNLVARSEICMFASDLIYHSKNEPLRLMPLKAVTQKIGQLPKHCRSFLNSETVVIYQTDYEDIPSPSGAPQKLYLAMGLDVIMRRYRDQLTYLNDVYLTTQGGNVLSSFVSANYQHATLLNGLDIESFQPVFNALKTHVSDHEPGTSAEEQWTLDVTLDQLRSDVKQPVQNTAAPLDWPFEAVFFLEGQEYHAAISPSHLKIAVDSELSSYRPVNNNQSNQQTVSSLRQYELQRLILIGLQNDDPFILFSERLSPLFHFTALFIAALLLLVMPLLHVILAKRKNSYSVFTLRLYGLAIALMTSVVVIGCLSYFTMLKQNMRSAQQVIKVAENIKRSWRHERNTSIEFLKQANDCFFNNYFGEKEKKYFQTICDEQFTDLVRYRNYKKVQDETNLVADTMLYKVEQALPMMGLLFVTDEKGRKLKPDWMARDYIPLNRAEVDLSAREYYSTFRDKTHWVATAYSGSVLTESWDDYLDYWMRAKWAFPLLAVESLVYADEYPLDWLLQDSLDDISDFSDWQIKKSEQPYYVQRIYNYLDGRKVSQLAIPRDSQLFQSDNIFQGVLSGEIMALSLEQPVLPSGMRFAVFDTKTGMVQYHSDRQRALVENIYNELESSVLFIDSIRANTDAMEVLVYRSEKLMAYTTPIPETNWTLLLTYDSAPLHSLVNETAVGTFLALVLLLFFTSIIVILYRRVIQQLVIRLNENYPQRWPWLSIWLIKTDETPWHISVRFYWLLTLILAVLMLVVVWLYPQRFLTWLLLYLLIHLALTRKTAVKTKKGVVATARWIRLNPMPLVIFLVVWIAIPTSVLFTRLYEVSHHQKEGYDFLQLQHTIESRNQFIQQHRDAYFYNSSQNAQNHWLDEKQSKLGVYIDQIVNPTHIVYRHSDQSVMDYQHQGMNFSVMGSDEKPSIEYDRLRACYLHNKQNEDSSHGLLSGMPALGKLANIAQSVTGYACDRQVDSNVRIEVSSSRLAEVWRHGLPDSFLEHYQLKRLQRLDGLSNLLVLISFLFAIAIFIYGRILIDGVYRPRWRQLYQRHRYSGERYATPRHRLFIRVSDEFIAQVMGLTVADSSVELSLPAVETDITYRQQTYKLFVYPRVDLAALDRSQRENLLNELEKRVSTPNTIVWMTADIPPLYRLLKATAYSSQSNDSELSPSHALRWANLFRQFSKDYDSARLSDLSDLLKEPLLEKQTSATPPAEKDYLDQELAAFAPQLFWIKDVIKQQQPAALTPALIRDLVAQQAGALYRYKWEKCTTDEKLMLYQIATGRYPSARNQEVIEHLLRRGYLKADPFLTIANQSFKDFILNAEPQSVFDKWSQRAERSSWQQLRIYLGVVVLLILAWLAYTSRDSYQQLAYVVGSLLTIFTALTQGANLLKAGRPSDSG